MFGAFIMKWLVLFFLVLDKPQVGTNKMLLMKIFCCNIID